MDGTRKEEGKGRGVSPGSLWKGGLMVKILVLATFYRKGTSQVTVAWCPRKGSPWFMGADHWRPAEITTLVPHKHQRLVLDCCISMHLLSVEKNSYVSSVFYSFGEYVLCSTQDSALGTHACSSLSLSLSPSFVLNPMSSDQPHWYRFHH